MEKTKRNFTKILNVLSAKINDLPVALTSTISLQNLTACDKGWLLSELESQTLSQQHHLGIGYKDHSCINHTHSES